jgi:hypothetical protein
MAVVINEFEVMPGPPQQAQGPEAAQSGNEQTSFPAEHEIERLVEHQMIRCERVWAY